MSKAAKPTGPFVTNPVNGEPVNPYLGGDPPLPSPESLSTETPRLEDRGDDATPLIDTGKEVEPETKVEETPAPAVEDKEQRIPKKRFDEVNERRKAAEAKVVELEKKLAPAETPKETPTYDFDAKEAEYMELLLDGKTKEALALRAEIRAADRAEAERIAATKAVDTNRQLSVEEKLAEITANAEATYPQFNADSDEFSEDLLDDVKVIYAGHLQSGKFNDAADAFQAAIDKATKLHGISAPSNKEPAPVRTAQKRVDAIATQPPLIAKVGHQSGQHGDQNIDIFTLPEADFARLPEATKRRMRGDDL